MQFPRGKSRDRKSLRKPYYQTARIQAVGDPNSVNFHLVKDNKGESRLLLLQGIYSILADFVEKKNTKGNAKLALGARSATDAKGLYNHFAQKFFLNLNSRKVPVVEEEDEYPTFQVFKVWQAKILTHIYTKVASGTLIRFEITGPYIQEGSGHYSLKSISPVTSSIVSYDMMRVF